MTNCQCRYACNGRHTSAIYNRKPRKDPNSWEPCFLSAGNGFLRLTCPFGCGHFRILQLCDLCFAQCERWMERESRVTCEGCLGRTTTTECWELFKDVK